MTLTWDSNIVYIATYPKSVNYPARNPLTIEWRSLKTLSFYWKWKKLAKAQLEANLVSEAIFSFIKAEDPIHYKEVIEVKSSSEVEGLVKFLITARVSLKDPLIETARIEALDNSVT